MHFTLSIHQAPKLVWYPFATILTLCYFALAVATMTNGHAWGDDWAQFVLHARNIATGLPYSETGYVFNPDFPNVGPPSYPPGVALLLAPVFAVTGVNLFAFKAVCFACLALALPLIFLLVRRTFSAGVSLFAVVLFAIHPSVWGWRQYITSEEPYLLFSMLTLWWAERPTTQAPNTSSSVAMGASLGLLIYASCISRSIGVALVPAVLVFGWCQRRPLSWFAGGFTSFALLFFMQTHFLVKPTAYENELKAPSLNLLIGNFKGYWMAFADLFPLPLGLSAITPIVFLALVATAAQSVCRFGNATNQGILFNLRGRMTCIPLTLWYALAYLCALVFAAIEPNPRYLLPLLPIVLAYAIGGTHFLVRRLPHERRLLSVLALAVVFYVAALYVRSKPSDDGATSAPSLEMFSFVRTHTAPGEVIAFAKPRAMALLGDRPSWRPADNYSLAQLVTKLRCVHSSVIVVGSPGSEFARTYPASPSVSERLAEPDATVVFRNGMFNVIQLNGSLRADPRLCH